jgi:drug/metabolite transporter (DMT)-like permease
LRIVGAGILFWALSFFMPKEKVKNKDLIVLFFAALLGIALNQSLFFEGLSRTTPVDASIIHVVNPIIVLSLSAIFLSEVINFRKISGIVLGAIGASMLILYGKELSFSSEHLLGNFLIFLNALAYASYLVVAKPIIRKYSTYTVMKWVYLFGFILVLPYTFNSISSISWELLWFKPLLALLYVIIGTTFFAYFLTIYGLKNLSATVVSFYIYLQPLMAAIIAIFIQIELLKVWKIFAALLIFTGVYLVNGKRKNTVKKKTIEN